MGRQAIMWTDKKEKQKCRVAITAGFEVLSSPLSEETFQSLSHKMWGFSWLRENGAR